MTGPNFASAAKRFDFPNQSPETWRLMRKRRKPRDI
jgi:hypothetical protein